MRKYILALIFIIISLFNFAGCNENISSDPHIGLVQSNVSYNINGKQVLAKELFEKTVDSVKWSKENLANGAIVVAELSIANNQSTVSFCYRVDDKTGDIVFMGVMLDDTYYYDDFNKNQALNAIIKKYKSL